MPFVVKLSFLIVLLSDCVNFTGISKRVVSEFIGSWEAVVQDGFGFIDILIEEVWSVDERCIVDRQRDVFDFEGSDLVIGLCCFCDVVFMVFRSYVVENFRAVVDVGIYEFLEKVGGGNIDFRGSILR